MAEGFARFFGGDRVDVRSGGSRPLGHVLPEAIHAMDEVGIDISGQKSEGFDEAWIRGADLVVTMGCGEDACPAFVGKRILDWELEDPAGQDLDAFRRVRDRLAMEVRRLIEQEGPE